MSIHFHTTIYYKPYPGLEPGASALGGPRATITPAGLTPTTINKQYVLCYLLCTYVAIFISRMISLPRKCVTPSGTHSIETQSNQISKQSEEIIRITPLHIH